MKVSIGKCNNKGRTMRPGYLERFPPGREHLPYDCYTQFEGEWYEAPPMTPLRVLLDREVAVATGYMGMLRRDAEPWKRLVGLQRLELFRVHIAREFPRLGYGLRGYPVSWRDHDPLTTITHYSDPTTTVAQHS